MIQRSTCTRQKAGARPDLHGAGARRDAGRTRTLSGWLPPAHRETLVNPLLRPLAGRVDAERPGRRGVHHDRCCSPTHVQQFPAVLSAPGDQRHGAAETKPGDRSFTSADTCPEGDNGTAGQAAANPDPGGLSPARSPSSGKQSRTLTARAS